MDGSFAAGNFIKAAVEGKDIVIAGDGTPYRSYLYAADLAIWLWYILLRGENMRPYNVGSDEEVTIEELARLIAAQSATGKTQVQVLTPRGNQPAQRYVPSVQRAKEELNLTIHTNLADAVKRTMEFYTV
jgi:dTDP-glucose 4,6-dehydratase